MSCVADLCSGMDRLMHTCVLWEVASLKLADITSCARFLCYVHRRIFAVLWVRISGKTGRGHSVGSQDGRRSSR